MKIHPNFKLNGQSFTPEQFMEIGYSLIKEGEAHELAVGDFLLDWLNHSDSLVVQTSGSTGQPKQIAIKKNHMVNSALATGSFFKLKPGDTALLCLSADFIAGKMMLVRAMVLGLELDIVATSSNPLLNNTMSYDFVAMVPLQVANSLESLHQIKTLIIGGAPVSDTLKDALQSIQTNCFETYGMTETITHIAARKLNNTKSDRSTYFKVLPSIAISKDNRGCLIIDAPKISNATIITNDLVELVDNKSFEWLGRFDNIINSGGIKLIPEQLEAKLSGLLDNRFFIIGFPDENLGQKLVLIVEGEQKINEIKQLIQSSGIFAKYEIPKQIRSLNHFVETESGKINRLKTLQLIH